MRHIESMAMHVLGIRHMQMSVPQRLVAMPLAVRTRWNRIMHMLMVSEPKLAAWAITVGARKSDGS